MFFASLGLYVATPFVLGAIDCVLSETAVSTVTPSNAPGARTITSAHRLSALKGPVRIGYAVRLGPRMRFGHA